MIQITPNMRITCITHNDMDGVFSGLVIRKKYPNAVVFTTNYGRTFDERWFDSDLMIVTDFSFSGLSEMMSIYSRMNGNVIWIDHHIVIDEADNAGFNPDGLRRKDVSAAHLCWEYCFPNTETPKVIEYISDYDIWKWQNNIDALYFQNAIRLQNISINQKSGTDLFEALLSNPSILERYVVNGKRIEEYNKLRGQLVCKDSAFVTKIDGVPALAANVKTANSTIFASMENDHPDIKLRVLFAYFSSINAYRVTLYSVSPEYSCHEICKKFGGGGHNGAAGFTVKSLDDMPFALPKPEQVTKRKSVDAYSDLWQLMNRCITIENHVKSGANQVVYGYSFGSNICGLPACCVNDPTGHVSMFYQTSKDSTYALGVFFNLMNDGWWRYRIYALDPTLDIEKLALTQTQFTNLKIQPDHSLIGFLKYAPLQIGGTNACHN